MNDQIVMPMPVFLVVARRLPIGCDAWVQGEPSKVGIALRSTCEANDPRPTYAGEFK